MSTTVRVTGREPVLARAGRYLAEQLLRRIGHTWPVKHDETGAPAPTGPCVTVRLARADEEFAGTEEFRVIPFGESGSAGLEIVAGAESVVMAAVGRFARGLDIRDDRVRARPGRHRPEFPIRGQVLANHKQTNTYDLWDLAQWEECLTELAAWGNNLVIVYPFQPSRWHGSLPFAEPPWFDGPEREREWNRQLEIQLRLPDLCHELGLRYGIYLSPNDIWPQAVLDDPELTNHGGPFVCPNRPRARAEVTELRRRTFAAFSAVDVLFIPSKDDGGCPACERCGPWAPNYIELVKEQADLVRQAHPSCAVWLSQQGLAADETRTLLDWLDSERPDYVESVVFGPFSEIMAFGESAEPGGHLTVPPTEDVNSAAPARLAAHLNSRYRLVLYPDEVHPWRSQYPVVDMDSVVQYVWNREDAPVPRIADTVRQFHLTSPSADGITPYSEGDTDDVNKFVWSRLMWDPSASPEELAREYAAWCWGDERAADGARLLLSIERALHGRVMDERDADERRNLVLRMERGDPRLGADWRWTMVLLCVRLLDHIRQTRHRDRDLVATLRYRVAEWIDQVDIRAGLERTTAYLERRLSESDQALAELRYLRQRLFDQHALRVRAVVRAQRSYQGFDLLCDRYRELARGIEDGARPSWQERRSQIIEPLHAAEAAHVTACVGVQAIDFLREFAWEDGPTRWHTA